MLRIRIQGHYTDRSHRTVIRNMYAEFRPDYDAELLPAFQHLIQSAGFYPMKAFAENLDNIGKLGNGGWDVC